MSRSEWSEEDTSKLFPNHEFRDLSIQLADLRPPRTIQTGNIDCLSRDYKLLKYHKGGSWPLLLQTYPTITMRLDPIQLALTRDK